MNTAQAYLGQQIYRRALVVVLKLFPIYKLEGQSLRIVWRWRRCGGAGSGRKCSLYQAVHSIGSRGEALTCVSRNQQQFIEKDADISSTYMQMDGKKYSNLQFPKFREVIMEVLEKQEKQKKKSAFTCFIGRIKESLLQCQNT